MDHDYIDYFKLARVMNSRPNTEKPMTCFWRTLELFLVQLNT